MSVLWKKKRDSGIELKQFIDQVLVDIVGAIQETNSKLAGSGAVVAPALRHGDQLPNDVGASPHVERVEFDIAVTAASSSFSEAKVSAGVAVNVVSCKLGSNGKEEQQRSSVSRVKFSVPVLFPQNSFERPAPIKRR